MTSARRRIGALFGATAACAVLVGAGTTGAANAGPSTLPPTWHIHDCTSGCVLPHAGVAFFPTILNESLSTYLLDPARCPDATDKAFLGGGQPPTTDGTETNQPLREGVCMTDDTIIHLKSVSSSQPAPDGWSVQGTSGTTTTYYRLTSY